MITTDCDPSIMRDVTTITMTDLTTLLSEDGAVGAGSIGSVPGLLFGGSKPTSRKLPAKPKADDEAAQELTNRYGSIRKFIKRRHYVQEGAATNGFDQDGVISRLQSFNRSTKASDTDTPTKCFGLEDSDGNVVKVYVAADQAEDFERSLQQLMTDEGDREIEIGELLFSLKDQFKIINTEFPAVEEDEEEVNKVTGGDDKNAEADLGDEFQLGDDGTPEGGADALGADGGGDDDALINDMTADGGAGGADTSSVETLLTQVIDMMTADAEARKADAEARQQEAKAKEAKSASTEAWARVKQEEQILDIDTAEKAKKDADKETEKLAKLAQYHHQLGDKVDGMDDASPDEGAKIVSKEEEEASGSATSPMRHRSHPKDVARFIMSRIRS